MPVANRSDRPRESDITGFRGLMNHWLVSQTKVSVPAPLSDSARGPAQAKKGKIKHGYAIISPFRQNVAKTDNYPPSLETANTF